MFPYNIKDFPSALVEIKLKYMKQKQLKITSSSVAPSMSQAWHEHAAGESST